MHWRKFKSDMQILNDSTFCCLNSFQLGVFGEIFVGPFKMAIKAIERLTMNIMNRRYLRFIMTLFPKI